MNPYENVQIGNFLISMGYALCKSGESLYGSINLYQQTPSDSATGDVFGVLNGRYFILEFKRDVNHLGKETDKIACKRLAEKLRSDSEKLIPVSNRAHLMIYPSWREKELIYHVQAYLQAIKFYPQTVENPYNHITSANDFVKEIYDKASFLGCSLDKIEKYTRLLWQCASINGSSGGGSQLSGLLICTDPEKKELHSYQFQSLKELNMTIEQSLALVQSKKMGMEKPKSQKRDISNSPPL